MDHCSYCGIEANDNELYEVINHDADEIQYVCGHCLEYYYTKCDQCGMFRPNESVAFAPDTGLYICNLCSGKPEGSQIPVLDMALEEGSWRD
jgi:hypothetical protein